MTIELANRLIELRKQHGYSQEELADKLNISRQAVSKWERADSSPDTDNLIELAKLYDMSLDELLGFKKEEVKNDKEEEKKKASKVHISSKGIHIVDEDGSTVDLGPTHIHIKDKSDDNDEDEDFEIPTVKTKTDTVASVTSVVLVFGSTIAYILLGTLLGLWSQAWILFLLVTFIPSLIKAIGKRNIRAFSYPTFIVFLYLLLCVWIFDFNYFHPLWVMFLSIPIYYSMFSVFKKKKIDD